jgi:hypothetical protein
MRIKLEIPDSDADELADYLRDIVLYWEDVLPLTKKYLSIFSDEIKKNKGDCMKATTYARKRPTTKPARKKNPMMEIHESLELISSKNLCDMNLFELSIRGPIWSDTYREIRNRLMLLQASLDVGDTDAAKSIVGKLLESPQTGMRSVPYRSEKGHEKN